MLGIICFKLMHLKMHCTASRGCIAPVAKPTGGRISALALPAKLANVGWVEMIETKVPSLR